MTSSQQWIEETLKLGLGRKLPSGALAVETGAYTGRAVNARLVARNSVTESTINWGPVNVGWGGDEARRYHDELSASVLAKKPYVYKGFVGPFAIEVTTTSPWHASFASNMFRSAPTGALAAAQGRVIRVFHDPSQKAAAYKPDSKEDALIVLDPETLRVGIVGTAYAGEIKKSAFTLCNYLLPEVGILPMHASANCREDGSSSCVLFGLSGTGKTTLSADPNRALIGDDEIVWTDEGLWNLEGGCYAKLIDLESEKEPEIWRAIHMPGAILENVVVGSDGKIDFSDKSRTENTRGSYPLSSLSNIYAQEKPAQAPRTIVFLTADAFGALPAVARLSFYQAQYHFVSGYTAKVAGTEMGVKEPKAAFSTCFGAPFMPRPPALYARLLAERSRASGATVWLLNTGWTGGGYGKGSRFPLSVTRSILRAIQSGELDKAPMRRHPVFCFDVPTTLAGVDPKYLAIPDRAEAEKLAQKFSENIEKNYKELVGSKVVTEGGPKLS